MSEDVVFLDKINPATVRHIRAEFAKMSDDEIKEIADGVVAFSDALNRHDPAAEAELMAWIESAPGYDPLGLGGKDQC